MEIETARQTIEIEQTIAEKYAQTLIRAEALVPGAGRDAIFILLTDARACIADVTAQTDRILIEGTLYAQTTYRQGDEETLRAVGTRTPISFSIEAEGVSDEMNTTASAAIEHVECKYENGHMVFFTTVSFHASARVLKTVDLITSISGEDGIETQITEICSARAVAHTRSDTSLREQFSVPAALDARTTLMEWGSAQVTSAEADLGGVRVKGVAHVETLISSGIQGHPATILSKEIPFDQLVDMPEWLSQSTFASAALCAITTKIDQTVENEDAILTIECELSIDVTSLARDCANVISDAYATQGNALDITYENLSTVSAYKYAVSSEQVRGTLLLGENTPGVGSVVAAIARPVLSGIGEDGTLDGVLEVSVLFIQGGADKIASAQAELPFSFVPQIAINQNSEIALVPVLVEATPLMSDRLDVRCALELRALTLETEEKTAVSNAEAGKTIEKQHAVVLYFPNKDDSLWTVGKRYSISAANVSAAIAPAEAVSPSKVIVMRL